MGGNWNVDKDRSVIMDVKKKLKIKLTSINGYNSNNNSSIHISALNVI